MFFYSCKSGLTDTVLFFYGFGFEFTGFGLDSVFQDLVSLGSNFVHRVQIRFVQDYWIVITM